MPLQAWVFLLALGLSVHAQLSPSPTLASPSSSPADPWEVHFLPLPEPGIHIELRSSPPGATVLVFGEVVGTTPHRLTLDRPAAIPLELRLEGHRPLSFTLDAVARGRYEVRARLQPAWATLDLSALPPDCVARSGDRILEGPQVNLPAGRHRLVLSRFGFRDVVMDLDLQGKQRLTLAAEVWEPLPWSVQALPLVRSRLNPELSGALGELRWPFVVSGAGSGELLIVEAAEDAVLDKRTLAGFRSPFQMARWRPGASWSEGTYRAILVLWDPLGQETRLETTFELSRQVRSSPVPQTLDLPPALAPQTARWVSTLHLEPGLVWGLGAEVRLPLAGWETSLAVSFHPSPEKMAQHARLRVLGPPWVFETAQGWVFWGAQISQSFTDLVLGGEVDGLAEGVLGLVGMSLWPHSGPYLTSGLHAGWRPVPASFVLRPWVAVGYARPSWGLGVGIDYDSSRGLPLELRSWAAVALGEGPFFGLGASLRGFARWETSVQIYLGIDP